MKLTIGMCTHDDFDGVWFTIQSIRMYHSEVIDDINFVVVDSNPDQPHGNSCEKLISGLTNKHGNCGLYVKNVTWKSTASRNYVFEYATTPYVLCVDSHVMLAPGSLKRLIDYYESHPDCKDLLHGHMINDNMKPFATRMDPVWEYNMYGKWIHDLAHWKNDEPYEVPMMGLGLFSSTKKAWLGFNQAFQGFGGEEGYIHNKYKKFDRKILMLPWLKWLHRFERPYGPPYNPEYIDRIKNYYIGWIELGLDTKEITDYYSKPNDIPGQERPAFTVDELSRVEQESRKIVEEQRKTKENTSSTSIDQLNTQKQDLAKRIEMLEKQIESMSKSV